MTTSLQDGAGLAHSGATAAALDGFDLAQRELRCLIGDPAASIERVLALAPDMTMAHVFKAYVHLLGTEPALRPVAQASAAAALALPGDERERRHAQAAQALAEGRWRDAGRALEDLSLRFPRDLLALQVGHQIDFFRGDSRMLRDRIARALPAWSEDLPGHHAVLGMHAFGLEETGDYAQAERQGRRCVELEPRDGWGWHAVAHVHEMRNAPEDGIAWLGPNRETWARESFFAVHNLWHLALFHLERGELDEVLRLYDEGIGGPGSTVVLDMIDASAMLWRLQLRGVDVGERWDALAQRWTPLAGAGQYAFNDLHAMMAFVGSGRAADAQRVFEAQRAALAAEDDNAEFTRAVGDPACRALWAFGAGDFGTCVQLLRAIRHQAQRFGGSHAQRDLIDLTLIEAARRGGDQALARGLLAERRALRPRTRAFDGAGA